jgi:hypothetical protein
MVLHDGSHGGSPRRFARRFSAAVRTTVLPGSFARRFFRVVRTVVPLRLFTETFVRSLFEPFDSLRTFVGNGLGEPRANGRGEPPCERPGRTVVRTTGENRRANRRGEPPCEPSWRTSVRTTGENRRANDREEPALATLPGASPMVFAGVLPMTPRHRPQQPGRR